MSSTARYLSNSPKAAVSLVMAIYPLEKKVGGGRPLCVCWGMCYWALNIFITVPYTAIDVLQGTDIAILTLITKTVALFIMMRLIQPRDSKNTGSLFWRQIIITIIGQAKTTAQATSLVPHTICTETWVSEASIQVLTFDESFQFICNQYGLFIYRHCSSLGCFHVHQSSGLITV